MCNYSALKEKNINRRCLLARNLVLKDEAGLPKQGNLASYFLFVDITQAS